MTLSFFSVGLMLLLTPSLVLSTGSRREDRLYNLNAYRASPGNVQCGPGTLSGWTTDIESYYDCASNAQQTSGSFNIGSGILTVPYAGVYRCCASAQIAQNGYGDLTINSGSTIRAGFGTRCTGATSNCERFSTSNCLLMNLAAADTVSVVMQSGAGSDCVTETTYRYTSFNCHLVFSTDVCNATP